MKKRSINVLHNQVRRQSSCTKPMQPGRRWGRLTRRHMFQTAIDFSMKNHKNIKLESESQKGIEFIQIDVSFDILLFNCHSSSSTI